ncbi:MAG: hypothetical protein HFH38_06545 [Lachnospiraceae bacterium]|jgi:hypothetical protein|nr:hypothetical protein [Lachnospiraceae bacterium]
MGLFRKRKKPKYVEEILEFDENAPQLQPGKEEKKGIVMEYGQQIMDAARNLEEAKREYKMLTSYLMDIEAIESMPDKAFAEIRETAQSIVMLHKSRDAYLNKAQTISEAQFAQMEQLEDGMPEVIKRLKANESYQTLVKRDMQYLEGEKGEWMYYQDALEREKKLLHKLLYALIGIFAAAAAAIVVLGTLMEFDIGMPFLMAALVAGGAGSLMVLRLQNDKLQVRKARANINRAIVLLNKVKFKYVNVTNAVDYACERYHVKNAYELNYIWEQYLEAVKEMEKYQRTNDDLEFFSGRLIRQLHKHNLYDTKVWPHQAQALVDKKEMVEVKHGLLVRRQKLRERVEGQVQDIQNAKLEIAKLMIAYPGNEREIRAILDSVDKICDIVMKK